MTDAIEFSRADAKAVKVLPLCKGVLEELLAQADAQGYRVGRIDLAGCFDKPGLLERTAATLEFPGWFGRNWDGWFDCLADLGWWPASGYVLFFEHADELRRTSPEALDTAIAILEDAALVWAARNIPFSVFVGITPP